MAYWREMWTECWAIDLFGKRGRQWHCGKRRPVPDAEWWPVTKRKRRAEPLRRPFGSCAASGRPNSSTRATWNGSIRSSLQPDARWAGSTNRRCRSTPPDSGRSSVLSCPWNRTTVEISTVCNQQKRQIDFRHFSQVNICSNQINTHL